MRFVRCAVLLVCVTELFPGHAQAQAIRGRVVSADSTRGLPGVVVALRDASGNEIARTLSAPNGAFVVRAPAAGSYRVRTLRIGYRPGDFGPYLLAAAAEDTVLLALRDIPVSLAAVRVSGSSECRSRESGGEAALAVWEEARKALLSTVLARADLQPVVTLVSYSRIVDPSSGRVVSQSLSRRVGPSTRPFVSPLPPEEYAARGYEEIDSTTGAGGATFRAPDADVLLSDGFAAGHCSQVAESPGDPTRVGLAFRPTRERLGIVDVAGTLWLDRRTGELRELEFKYLGLDPLIENAGAGGRMEFLRLPTGLWMIDRWQIRIPRLAVTRGFEPLSNQPTTRRSVAELWDVGGELSSVRVDTAIVWRRPPTVLEGTVVDEATGAPTPRATVSLAGTSYRASADTLGHFVIADVLPGKYEAEVRSPAAVVLADEGALIRADVEVRDSNSARVRLRAPSLHEALARACTATGTELGGKGHDGVIQGFVRHENGAPFSGATVVARWVGAFAINDAAKGAVADVTTAEQFGRVAVGHDGVFRICGVATDRPVRLVASFDVLRSDPVITRVAHEFPITTVDLRLARAIDSVAADGSAMIAGTVVDDAGVPVPGTTIQVFGFMETRTDSLGRYHVSGLAAGNYFVRFRKIGLAPLLENVPVGMGERVTRDVQMHRGAQLLDTVVVSDSRITTLSDPTGFDRRRLVGQGTYITEAQIDNRHATETAQLLRGIPNVRIDDRQRPGTNQLWGPQFSGSVVWIDRGRITLQDTQGGGAACDGVQVFIDGVQTPQPFDVNLLVPSRIKAIELYKDAGTLPAELWSYTGARCGTLAIWTK